MPPTAVAITPALPSELLEYVLTQEAYPTTLLICQPRGVFLASLIKAVKHTSPTPPLPNHEGDAPSEPTPTEEHLQRHPLLVPTLHQVATSRFISLVFIPTVTHLRAYLAVFPVQESKERAVERVSDKRGSNRPLMVIYGMVTLHRDTSEWSAQGLGSSLAECVEAGWRNGRKVVVLEEKTIEDDANGEIGGDGLGGDEGGTETARDTEYKGWEERVPMLNGSVRRTGPESEDGGWSGRTVEVGRILSRWFKFKKGEWQSEGNTRLEAGSS